MTPPPAPIADTTTGVDGERRLPSGTLVAGRYRVMGPLGFGGMGVVYRARDEELGQEIAVKVLRPELGADPQWVERFRRELLLAREVTHKNVVRIHDIGESDGLRFLTMRLVEGRSLLDLITQEGRLPVERALRIFRQVAEGLQHAHQAGIVHRDIKPANVLLGADDTAYLTDFGIARSLDRPGHTQAGTVPGTLDYLSPEQVAGDEADARSDVYALGILLYEMLSGELPFPQGSRAEVLAQRIAGRPRDIADAGVALPAYVRALVRRCLQRSPERRHQTVADLLHDLDAARVRWRDRLPRTRSVVAAGLVLALLAAGAAAWSTVRRDPPPAPAPVPSAVAILPLTDQTGDPSLAWTAAGLAEMLAGQLAETPQLRVLDPTRVLRTVRDLKLEGTADDHTLRRLADLLEVGHLVTGTVRRAGAAVRVDLRLASRAGAGGLSTRTLAADAPAADGLFRMLDELGEALRAELGSPPSLKAPPSGAQTRSLEAAAAYREGRDRLLVGDAVGAAPAFERAVAADPSFAAALEALSEAYQALGYHDQATVAAERAGSAAGAAESRLGWRIRARLALLRGEPAEAEKAYAELVRRYPNDAQALLDLAAAQTGRGAAADAVTTLRRVTELDKADARAWLLLGRNMIMVGEVREAVTEPLFRALALMRKYGNEQGRGDVLNAMGVAYQRLGEYPQAIAHYGEAAEIRATIGDERGTAVSRKNRAGIHLAMGQFAQAEPDLAAAREVYDRIGDRRGLADVWNDFGALHEGRGAFAQARAAYREALRLRQELGDDQKLAQSYDNVGYVFFLEGEYDNARVYWRQALGLHDRTGDRAGWVLTTQNMGFLHTVQGRWSEAAKAFLDALQVAREIDFKNAVAVSEGNLGLLQQYEGRYGAALSSFGAALAIVKDLGDRRGLAEYTLREAAALIELGQLDPAKDRLDAAGTWVEETGNREHRADHHTLLGQWHLVRGDGAAARRAFARAEGLAEATHSRGALLRVKVAAGDAPAATLREAESLGDTLLRVRATEALARAELRAGRAAEAAALARRAVRAAERAGWTAGLYRLHALLGRALERQGDPAAAAAYEQARQSLERLRERLPADMRPSFEASRPVREATAWAGGHPAPSRQSHAR